MIISSVPILLSCLFFSYLRRSKGGFCMKERNPIVFLIATVTLMFLLVMGGSTLLPALALEAPPYYHTQLGSGGSGDGEFNYPSGVTVDSSGNVYVADSNNHRIQKFDSDGVFVTKWGSKGSGDGQFQQPSGIAIDSSGNVYVADSDNHRIQKFGTAPPTPTPTSMWFFLPSIINASTPTNTPTTTSTPTTSTPTPTVTPTVTPTR